MDPGVRPLGKIMLCTCTNPIALVVTIMLKSCPMVMVCVAVLIGLDLFVVIAIGMPPMAMMKAHLPLTIPVSPCGMGGTTILP